jgi:NADPH:quinone reductase-like Zn-dependent oxidoreductase
MRLGVDLAGVVAAIGGNVTRFTPGDEVFGVGTGTLAEYVAAPEDGLVQKPADLSFEQAAAVPWPRSPPCRAFVARAGFSRGNRCWSTGRREASAPSPCSSPRCSARR